MALEEPWFVGVLSSGGGMSTGESLSPSDGRIEVKVNVVIPTLNSEHTLDNCLDSISRNCLTAVSVTVVDGGSRDKTRDIAMRHGARFVRGDFKRSEARRMGVATTESEFVLFLDSDQVASPGLLDECVAIMSNERIGAIKIPETLTGKGIWFKLYALDNQLFKSDALSYPRFLRAELYRTVGGHVSVLEDYMEDRMLYIQLLKSEVEFTWSKGSIANDMGAVNPLSISLKGARAARDSSVYYAILAGHSDLSKTLGEKFRALIGNLRGQTGSVLLLMLPVFSLIIHGPRLLVASFGRGRVWARS